MRGALPHEVEVYNGFKERMKENMLLEQARSMIKSDAISKFVKKQEVLDVFVNTAKCRLDEEQPDQITEDDSPLGIRPRVNSVASERLNQE